VLKWFSFLLRVACVICARAINTGIWQAIIARTNSLQKNVVSFWKRQRQCFKRKIYAVTISKWFSERLKKLLTFLGLLGCRLTWYSLIWTDFRRHRNYEIPFWDYRSQTLTGCELMWDRVTIPKVILTGENVATTASEFLSYLTVKKLLEKKTKAKPTWRSIFEVCIRTNTRSGWPTL